MKKPPRENRKWVVRYEPLPEGIDEGILEGVQGEFDNAEDANAAARQCDMWFNRPTILEHVEHAETGRTVPVKRQLKLKKVRIWIEQTLNGDPLEGTLCEAGFEHPEEKRSGKSGKAALAAG